MKLWFVEGCLMNGTIVDFFGFRPVLNAPFSAYNQEPTIMWTNHSTVWVEKGKSVTLTLRVSNTDSPLCTPVTYTLVPKAPPDWKVDLMQTLFLMPGQTCFIEFTIYPPEHTDPGSYNVSIDINGVTGDMQAPSFHNATISTLVSVAGSCSKVAPQLLLLHPLNYFEPGESVNTVLSLQNNDGATCAESTFEFK